MRAPPVTFFYPYPDEIAQMDTVELGSWDFWSHEGKERRRAWVLQTYLRLREAGYGVDISSSLPGQGIVVLLAEKPFLHAFLSQYTWQQHRSLVIATIRADIIGFRPLLADADIVQNGRFANEKHTFFVPHWPQPGLIPRDQARGNTIKNIAFKGGFGSLREEFHSAAWQSYLDRRDMSFEIASKKTQGDVPQWHDYSSADLVLAVRPSFDDGGLRYEKPAAKLVNAWQAGVPALLGPEYAYRELRESKLDYVEVDSVEEAMMQIDRLRSCPVLYRRMIEHGRSRAEAFTPRSITERWAKVLFEKVPRLQKRHSVRLSRSLPLGLRRVFNWLAMPPAPFELRKQVGHLVRRFRET